MLFGKKALLTSALLGVVVFISTTSMQQTQQAEEHKFQNLKVLPKNISEHQLHEVMDEWNAALGVRCNFCHARNEETKKMDWALDAKPEKNMAREMFKMTANINKKYFKAGKDSLGMVMYTGVNCNTCHKGNAHPEVKAAHTPRAEGMRPQPQPAQAPAQ